MQKDQIYHTKQYLAFYKMIISVIIMPDKLQSQKNNFWTFLMERISASVFL